MKAKKENGLEIKNIKVKIIYQKSLEGHEKKHQYK